MDVLNTKIKNILAEKVLKIKPENIKKDVTVFDVTGSYEGLDTSDATATAGDIKTDKTAYVNGQKIIGTFAGIIPTGTVSITQNGTVDVTNYAEANVNVSGGGGDSPITQQEYEEDLALTQNILTYYDAYTELEYIQSTGSQYFDTGYYPNEKTKIEMIMQPINWGEYKNPFGVRTAVNNGGTWVYTNRFALWLYNTKNIYYHLGYNENRIVHEFQRDYTNVKFKLIAGNGYISLQDLTNNYEKEEYTFTSVSTFTTDYSLVLGALRNNSNILNLCAFKLYSCKIYENDVLIHDWIPAINNANNNIGLYDKETGNFIYDSGTGDATGGALNV